ncbi:DMT family transporter [Tropicibacter sp. R15_0]|uniref:DMT family transporter n=1 Tax=Tropicibacter sp. R15_0 TaxID=2821101 RepID=UPI001ADB79D8|nr:DMT family transporter [Tropicibacter sp. R15_0]MBO9464058.1 DMT family transporter [Tropicibacter sp. R15_0]
MPQASLPTQSPLQASLFGLAAFAVFATHDVIIKLLGGTYSAIQILFFGALLSFPIITVILMRDREPGTLRPKHPGWIALRSVSGSFAALGAFYAFSVLPLAQTYAILFAAPLLITLLAIPILGERVRLRRGLAVLAGLVGVMVVLRPGGAEFGLGHAAALLSAVTGALNSIVVRKVGAEERTVVMILYPMMTNFILMGLALPFVYKPVALGDLGLMAVVASMVLIAMAFLIMAYQRGPAVMVAPMQYSQILWAALFGALFFDEYPDTATYIGAGIIILSGLYILRRESGDDVSENRPVLRTRTRVGLPVGPRVGALMKTEDKEE